MSRFLKVFTDSFNKKEMVDSEVNEDLASFINVTFREGISDEKQSDILKNIQRPVNCDSLVKTRVNSSIWRLLKPHTQSEDVKMQLCKTIL